MRTYANIILSALYNRKLLTVQSMRDLTGSCHGLKVIYDLRQDGIDIVACLKKNVNTGKCYNVYMLNWKGM